MMDAERQLVDTVKTRKTTYFGNTTRGQQYSLHQERKKAMVCPEENIMSSQY